MCAPVLSFTNCCFKKIPMGTDQNPKLGDHCFKIAPTIDAIVSITCLVMGILGVMSIVTMPPAAAYALIGISGGITLLWIAMVVRARTADCCKPKQQTNNKTTNNKTTNKKV